MESVVYLVSRIDGRWEEHHEFAEQKLNILCKYLEKRRLAKKITISHGSSFDFPTPNFLKLKDFFGNPKDWNSIAKEIEDMRKKGDFVNMIHSSYEGYYIARIIDSGEKTEFWNRDLLEIVRDYADMFDVYYCAIPENSA